MYYFITISPSSSLSQQEATDKLKSKGAEVIQTSSGLCVKSNDSTESLNKILGADSAVRISPASESASDLSEDVKAFMGI